MASNSTWTVGSATITDQLPTQAIVPGETPPGVAGIDISRRGRREQARGCPDGELSARGSARRSDGTGADAKRDVVMEGQRHVMDKLCFARHSTNHSARIGQNCAARQW